MDSLIGSRPQIRLVPMRSMMKARIKQSGPVLLPALSTRRPLPRSLEGSLRTKMIEIDRGSSLAHQSANSVGVLKTLIRYTRLSFVEIQIPCCFSPHRSVMGSFGRDRIFSAYKATGTARRPRHFERIWLQIWVWPVQWSTFSQEFLLPAFARKRSHSTHDDF